jgi:hypothetical protein
VNFILVECACWATIEGVRWALIKGVGRDVDLQKLGILYSKQEVVFTFFIFDDVNPYILIGFKKEFLGIEDFLKIYNYNDVVFDWAEIIKLICMNN